MQDRMFDYLDEDRSGHINSHELMSAFRMMGCPTTQEEVVQLIAQVDPDHSANLDRSHPPTACGREEFKPSP